MIILAKTDDAVIINLSQIGSTDVKRECICEIIEECILKGGFANLEISYFLLSFYVLR